MAQHVDEQNPDPAGRGNCSECGKPFASDQRYCLGCGHRHGLLPGAVAGTLALSASKAEAAPASDAAGTGSGSEGAGTSAGSGDGAGGGSGNGPDGGTGAGSGDGDGGWSWMPSPQAIAIAVIGMLALGVGLGSAMSEVASSAPLSTILLEYPRQAAEAAPEEEPEVEEEEEGAAEEAPVLAEAPEEEVSLPEEAPLVEPLPEELPAAEETLEEPGTEEESALERSIRESEEEQEGLGEEEAAGGRALPQIKHAWLIVLGENSYESTYSATADAPYLTRVLPGKGELIPNYYGVTTGVLANEIALLSGQGPTPETSANCPNFTPVVPATVSALDEQVEGNGCLYPRTVESLPTQLEEKELTWRAYVEDMEKGGAIGQPFRCRRPAPNAPDTAAAMPGDQYVNWRNPLVYFGAIAEDTAGCEKHDVGFEILTKDLRSRKATPALSLIFPNVCHSGGEIECEPGAPTGAKGATQLLKTLVPAIMASPAYEEGGGLIMITSAQAPQAGKNPDSSACCLAPGYPNLLAATGTAPAVTPPITGAPSTATPAKTPGTTTGEPAKTAGTTTGEPAKTAGTTTGEPAKTAGTTTGEPSTTESTTNAAEEPTTAESTTTKYTEESVLQTGGGGQVGLLLISPLVEAGKVEETEYANHFTLLKTLETMFGVEPLGYAAEPEVPTLSPDLFLESSVAGEAATGEEEEVPPPAEKASGPAFGP